MCIFLFWSVDKVEKPVANHDFMWESFEKVDHVFARNCYLMPLLHNGPKGPAISVIACGMRNVKCPNFSFKTQLYKFVDWTPFLTFDCFEA